jgi:hypothetical protein
MWATFNDSTAENVSSNFVKDGVVIKRPNALDANCNATAYGE